MFASKIRFSLAVRTGVLSKYSGLGIRRTQFINGQLKTSTLMPKCGKNTHSDLDKSILSRSLSVARASSGFNGNNQESVRDHCLSPLSIFLGFGALLSIFTVNDKNKKISQCENSVPSRMSTQTPQPAGGPLSARKVQAHGTDGMKVFSGNANSQLAQEVASQLGITLGKITVGRFADGEVNVMCHENVRGKDVYIIQPTCSPVNENLMELLLMVSTMRRASARRITVVIPYYGYARQDRKMQARVPISAADVARLLESMGVDRVVAVDLHCGQIQGFFGPRVPVDNLDGGTVGVSYFGDKDLKDPVIVSPDAGGVYRAKKFREGLAQKYDIEAGLAMIVKQRSRANEVDKMDLVGEVQGSDVMIVDDMIDTAGTLCKAADVLLDNGARRVYAFATHGLFSGKANINIGNSNLEEVVVLNTIPCKDEMLDNTKVTYLSVAPLIAQAIYNIHQRKSISALFK